MPKTNLKKPFIFFVFLVSIVLPNAAAAHRVNVFAYEEGSQIHLETYFASGSVCRSCKIEVKDNSGKIVHQGQTDDQGKCVFSPKNSGKLTIVVIASMGHRAETTFSYQGLKAENFDAQSSGNQPTQKMSKEDETNGGVTSPSNIEDRDKKSLLKKKKRRSKVDYERVRSIVREEVRSAFEKWGRDVKPRPKSGVETRDIVAGLGIIVGVFGLLAFVKSRKDQ